MKERFQVVKLEGWTSVTGGNYKISYTVHDLDYAGQIVSEYSRSVGRPISKVNLEALLRREAWPLKQRALVHARYLNVREKRALEALEA